MVKVSIHETDTSAAIGLEVQKFLEFLVNNVDFKADNAVECLKELRNSRLPKKYSTTITNAVRVYYSFMYCMHDSLSVGKPKRDGRDAAIEIDSDLQIV